MRSGLRVAPGLACHLCAPPGAGPKAGERAPAEAAQPWGAASATLSADGALYMVGGVGNQVREALVKTPGGMVQALKKAARRGG